MFTRFSRNVAKSGRTLELQAPRKAISTLCFSSGTSVPQQAGAFKHSLQTRPFCSKDESSDRKSNSENGKNPFFNNENIKILVSLLSGGLVGSFISSFFNTQISKRAAREKVVEELRQDFKERQKTSKILLKRAIKEIEEFQLSYTMMQGREGLKIQDTQDLLYDLNLALIDNKEMLDFIDFVKEEITEKIKVTMLSNNDWEFIHFSTYFDFFNKELVNQRELLTIAKNLCAAVLCFKETNYVGAQQWIDTLRLPKKSMPEFEMLDFKKIKYTQDQREAMLNDLLNKKFQNWELRRPKLHPLSLSTINGLQNNGFCIPKFRRIAYHLNGMILNEGNDQKIENISTEALDNLLYALTENPGNACLWVNLGIVLENIPSLAGFAPKFSEQAFKLKSSLGIHSPSSS